MSSELTKIDFVGELAPLADAQDDAESIVGKIMLMEAFRQWSKQRIADVEESIRERLEDLGSVQVGELVYFSGLVKSDPKCVNVPAAASDLLSTVGGDWDAFCQHLSSGAIKYGSYRATMGAEKFAEYFRVDEKAKLVSEDAGKARKRLVKMNPSFAK